MKYIANCMWKDGKIDFILFGYTEAHYIENYHLDNTGELLDVYMIHVWKSYTGWSSEYNYHNERFDPGTESAKWSMERKYVYDSFEEACLNFFNQLFGGNK